MVCPEKWQAHERCDFPSRLARPDCHRRRDRRTRRRQPATHHSRRLERASELGKRALRSLVSVLFVDSVLLFVFSVLNLWLCPPPAAKDFHHRGHKGHREEQSVQIRTTCHLPPVTCCLSHLFSAAWREPRAGPCAARQPRENGGA